MAGPSDEVRPGSGECIVGQGQLIIGYPFGGTVEVVNEGDRVEFLYEPLIRASIINRPGERGLFDLRTLARPKREFQPFRGPMGAAIQSYAVEGKNIVVSYHLVIDQEVATPQKPIARCSAARLPSQTGRAGHCPPRLPGADAVSASGSGGWSRTAVQPGSPTLKCPMRPRRPKWRDDTFWLTAGAVPVYYRPADRVRDACDKIWHSTSLGRTAGVFQAMRR